MSETKTIDGHAISQGGDTDKEGLYDLTGEFQQGGQTRADADRQEAEVDKRLKQRNLGK